MADLFALGLLGSIFAVGVLVLAYGLVAVATMARLRWSEGTVGDLSSGLLSLTGTAVERGAEGTVTSPVTGEDALVYDYELQRHEGTKSRPDWTTHDSGGDGRPFELRTAAGSATVDPAGATVAVDADLQVEFTATPDEVASLGPIADAVAGDGESVVVDGTELVAGEDYRLVERRIEAGTELQVSGSARIESSGTGESETGPRLSAQPDRGPIRRRFAVPLVLDDPDGAGARGTLRNRAVAGLVFGLPFTMLAVSYGFAEGA
jgi:hypothetical protein